MSRWTVDDTRPRAPRARRRALPAVVAVALVWGVTLAGTAAASGPLGGGDAAAQARTIAAKIDALQPQVDAALAGYDRALEGVALAVGRNAAAEASYEWFSAAAEDAAARRDQNVADLYRSGGLSMARLRVLDSDDPILNLGRDDYMRRVLVKDDIDAQSAAAAAAAAQAHLQKTDAAADHSVAVAGDVEDRLNELQDLLAEQQALLDHASVAVRMQDAARRAQAQVDSARAAANAAGERLADRAQPTPIPADFRALYLAGAKTCPGLPWQVLAAIGQVESHHNPNVGNSSAGAEGPMQFLPSTFAAYAVDGNHDGRLDIHNPADAIYTAARYLCANGGGKGDAGLRNAIWNYNHADWYVRLVLNLASKIT